MAKTLQEKILAAASELFYSEGIRATGVDAIAKAANTTKMSMHKYFPSSLSRNAGYSSFFGVITANF